ncbi:MerR family transcriptional regulator [Thiocapsa roseopersicina]|uniref:MerR HTH family regulatory protein n=1 Tax=Thiocapsa roseopersicina TaxID=1058 RepID=A0A1H2YXZ8_THIRO|nr:MerR family transcriptional regulator [Thiocapsa roseopersicina]SDX09947.1 MerR HTH family regulatory protein [Thiocapsa roseopersicina]
MTDQDAALPGHTYRIGAVSRLTGVPADTLRVWERRYSVVAPLRSESGTRLYGPDDVSRLTLIKRLVDRGDAISSVANLSLDQLRERIRGTDLPEPAGAPERPCRVLVIGSSLAERFRREPPMQGNIDLVGLYDSRRAFLAAGRAAITPDVAVLEYPSIQGDQVREIGELVAQCGATRAILVYNFATRATIERLDARRLIPKRAPVDLQELRQWCMGQFARAPARTAEEPALDLSLPIPPRRFADADLLRIATASPSVRCECPHHLVDLVLSLNAFESYSAECEDRNAEDAALHAYLHAATAQARAMMEVALARVVAAEGILLDTSDREI